MKKFEFLEHTADIKFRAHGKTLNEAFENSVSALAAYLSGDQKIASRDKKTIDISGSDYESLLYSLLDELLFLLDSEGFMVSNSRIQISGFSLKAELHGDNARKYDLDHIKAATYSEMYVKKVRNNKKSGGDHWEIQAVLDV